MESNKKVKTYDYSWIDFLNNGNTVLVKNEKDFAIFKEFLQQHNLIGILGDSTEFENWRNLASINNMKPDIFLFEYANDKGLTWSDNIEESIEWHEKEPLKPEELLTVSPENRITTERAYEIFILGYDLLNKTLSNSVSNECDNVFEKCNNIAKDFEESEFNSNNKGLYECLKDYTDSEQFTLTLYAKEFLEEFNREFQDYNINYYPRISFVINSSNIQMFLAIDSKNTFSEKEKQISFLTEEQFSIALTENLLTGDSYTASIVKSKNDTWNIDDVKKDFKEICHFNYLQDEDEENYDR